MQITDKEAFDAALLSLGGYIGLQYPGYLFARHHLAIISALERVERGECKRLIISMPPRHGKSMLVSEFFPAWFLGRNPDKSIITSSYASELAEDFGRKVRNQCLSLKWKMAFPGVALDPSSQSSARFNLLQGGSYYAVGVGGATTGRGAHCIEEGSLISTPYGEIPIEKICVGDKVLSYNHDTGQIEIDKVVAVRVKNAEEIYRLRNESGRILKVTGEHPVYARGKYTSAYDIAEGDPVLQIVRKEVRPSSVSNNETYQERASGFLLQSGMQQGRSCDKEQCKMSGLRGDNSSIGQIKTREVLPRVQQEVSQAARKESRSSSVGCDLPSMQHSLQSSVARKGAGEVRDILQQEMRGNRAFNTNVGAGESEMASWDDTSSGTATLCESIQGYSASDFGKRSSCLCSVRSDESTAGSASHGLVSSKQCGDKSCNSVLPLSQNDTREDLGTISGGRISDITRVHTKAVRVFDLEIEKNHNFFAESFLVHNCFLIDDPVKDREQADSETIRRKVKDWYRSVAYTRLMRGGAVIIVMTRWHEDDLAGWCMEEQGHEDWELLSLPAIAEDNDALGRAKGEPLWPERFDLPLLETIRQTVGPREWQALYQQRPAPDEGAYFKREWMQTYDTLPPYLRYYGASDYAVTADGGDYTVHVLAGVDESENIYIVDLWRGQTDALEWIDAWSNIVRMYKPQIWAEEGGVILRSLDPIIRKRCQEQKIYSTYRQQFASVADKPTRARSLQARMQMGKVFFPSPSRCPWVADLMAEMLTFPVGKHDDQVDALSLLTRMLAEMRPAKVPVPEKTLTQRVQEAVATPWTAHDLFEKHFAKRRQARAV